MSIVLTPGQLDALRSYSQGAMTALDLRRRLDDATYGEVVSFLSAEHLPLPRAPQHGREEQMARARKWLFRRMGSRVKLFVIDTGPLITLAIADSLDYLLYVQADIIIPDAVLYEATHDAAKLGAQDIMEWVKLHRARIELAPTKSYAIFEAARASIPKLKEPGLGERAAVEVIEEPDRLVDDERAVLLCEESAVLRRVVVRDKERIVELSTMDFLRILESERRIQSADQVFEVAQQAGRHPSRTEKLPTHTEETTAAIRDLVRKSDDD